MKILVLDNYDSFTYNLVHILRELGYGSSMEIFRNDKISLSAVDEFDKILLSPGPGIPSEAGIMLDLILQYGSAKSIIGICLGHQAIAEAYGASIYNMTEVLHGVSSPINILDTDDAIFKGLPQQIEAGRYHSWAVVPETVNANLRIIARGTDSEVMALRHRQYDVVGVQFHPESVLTEWGKDIIKNWVEDHRS